MLKGCFKTGMAALAVLTMAVPSALAENWQSIDLIDSSITVQSGGLQSLNLKSVVHIQKLLIQAESGGRGDALFDVIVNGDVKGTIHVPGHDPTYVVNVNQAASSIQFRMLQGHEATIRRVMAVVTQNPSRAQFANGPIALADLNVITSIALRAIEITHQIENHATPLEMNGYVLPMRASAGRLYAVAAGRGPYSSHVYNAALDFLLRVDAAKPFIDGLMQRSAAFEVMVELLSLRAGLDDLIDRP
jgi:hypothetical protein